MEQLYIVRFLPSNVMFFIGPMRSLQVILQLHKEACTRIELESASDGQCVLYNIKLHGNVLVKPIGLQHD